MKYKLERNTNGTVTQVINADGGSIYDARPELRKLNEEALKRPTPGKLGNLANLQIFNINFNPGSASTAASSLFKKYNTTVTTGNVTDCIMFGAGSLSEKALYYNIIDVQITVYRNTNNNVRIFADSYIEFYLLENIETSTTALGRKIPRQTPLTTASAGVVTFNTTDPASAYQFFKVSASDSSVNIPSELKGLRCSGIALKQLDFNFSANEDLTNIRVNVSVFVDNTSVSSTY